MDCGSWSSISSFSVSICPCLCGWAVTDGGDSRCGGVASAVGHTVELHWVDRRVVLRVPFDSLRANPRTRSSSRVQDGAAGSFGLGLAMEKPMAFNMRTPGAFTGVLSAVWAPRASGRGFSVKAQLPTAVTRKCGNGDRNGSTLKLTGGRRH